MPGESKPEGTSGTQTKMIGNDKVQIEFVIDDLVKQLVKDRLSRVASCNGCNSCGGNIASKTGSERK